ncbi:MAG: hypothetical protein QXR19_02760 [Candidatus Jordarchaeaceae archaeon]
MKEAMVTRVKVLHWEYYPSMDFDYKEVLPYFESVASSPVFDMREMAQMFFRRLIRRYLSEMRECLLQLVKSEDAKIRKFVAETLRPVQENRWFYENPDYPLSVLKHMFKEGAPYPSTAVGNNLGDLAKMHPYLVYDLVKEQIERGDENFYWTAYLVCRNLVKGNQP